MSASWMPVWTDAEINEQRARYRDDFDPRAGIAIRALICLQDAQHEIERLRQELAELRHLDGERERYDAGPGYEQAKGGWFDGPASEDYYPKPGHE